MASAARESSSQPGPSSSKHATSDVATNGTANKTNEEETPEPQPEPFSWLKPHMRFVVILVGGERVPFAMHLNFLRARSGYISEMYRPGTAGIENVMDMPDTTPEIFGYAQHFLFTGLIIPEGHEVPPYEDLIGLWHLGDTLKIDGLCDKTLEAMHQCRRATQRIPSTPLLVQAWKDTPEGSSIRQLLLSWAAEYMRTSDVAQDFAKSLPQEVLSELVVVMSMQAAQPKAPSPEPAAPSPPANGAAPRKSVHYLDSGSENESRSRKARRVSGPAGAAASPATAPPERKAHNRKFVKSAIPKRRSSGAVGLSEAEFTNESKVQFCADLLDRMLSGPGFWTRLVGPFREPVDPVKDQVPDYFERVTTPMDLMTIKGKMDANKYTNAEEFAEDVRTIFRNCYDYWTQNDPMWVACERFEKTFEEKFGLMHKTISKLMREPVE
ncbi:hypothetical protein F5X68DRAFT_6213 [Plectosphaerella plurivora]|uniref:Bromo domain-containing protein n=1 Tax=Plectosphaerella plurivora TaxID=936078 RepID=A0A9P9A8S3_9PEZI|nr:hypothetical protein F5X68DRAFT_6213 [Plectosphaerella plurivora]